MSKVSDECRTCKYRFVDCGNHHVDFEGKIHLDIPSEAACDRWGQCMFWKRSIESRQDEIQRLKNLIDKHNEQIEQLEREIQREKEEDERMKKAKDGMSVRVFIVDEFLYETKEGDGS